MKNVLFLALVICFSCGEDPVPKPQAYLRLEYPKADYVEANVDLPFTFEKNMLAKDINSKPIAQTENSYGLTLDYPDLKGTIYLTYKPVRNNREVLITYLRDAQNLTQKHTVKADEIIDQAYENRERKVYGVFYEVGGNAASQSQFYVTDSVNHFLTGSLYFNVRPNYDSILPAAHYLKNDIKHIMETIRWK